MKTNKYKKSMSLLYSVLLCFLVLKVVGIIMLINADNEATAVPIVEPQKAIAEEQTYPAKRETTLAIDMLDHKKSDFFKKAENSYLETEVIHRERAKLKREKELLIIERQQLEELKKEIDIKLKRLVKVQKTVQQKIEEQKNIIKEEQEIKQTSVDKHFKHLLKIYNSMPSKKSAALIENLDMEVTIKLLSSMKGENVGQILGYVTPEKAARISERLAKLNKESLR